jgi:two-component system, NtrC family, sensor histidine kinase PilS
MNQQAFALITMTALVAGLVAVLVFAALRFAAAARDNKRHLSGAGMETALLSQALEDAITMLKTQERAMAARAEASERLSGQIVASLTAGLVVTDLDGRVQIVNPSSRRLLGLGDAPLEGTVSEVLGPASPLTAAIEECLRDRQPIVRRSLELADLRTDVTHLGVTVSPLVSESGESSGVICLFTDLTAVVDLEEQLRLKDTLARLGELTAGLAHEFRNGLATVHGYARLLNLEALPAQERKYLEGLRAETEALGQVVTNFLSFARPTQLAVTPIDLGQVAQRVADELQGEVVSRGGRLEVSGTWAVIEGDEVLLRQALSNLARNAVEACAIGGIVPDVRIDAVPDVAARVLRVQVTDNGPGIDPGLRERIFRPFFTTKRDGTGLGLALVQKIVVTHNGRVQAGPGPGGRGTTMAVTLPLPELLPKVAV